MPMGRGHNKSLNPEHYYLVRAVVNTPSSLTLIFLKYHYNFGIDEARHFKVGTLVDHS